MLLATVSFIVALGILIFVHELGHFLFAKLFGVGVEKFSLGFGPKLFGIRYGETEYMVSVFPLGGYVKMVGENAESELTVEQQARSFLGKAPLKRIVIVAAGPGFNLLFAWLVYIVVLMVGTPFDSSRIMVIADRPAAKAGLKNNDVITAINGKPAQLWEDVTVGVLESKGKPIKIGVQRDGAKLEFQVAPETIQEKSLLGELITRPMIGVKSAEEKIIKRFDAWDAVLMGGGQVIGLAKLIVMMLGKIIAGVIPVKGNIGGPISIAVEAGKQAAAGLDRFVLLLAGLSVNLGILNLLPIPVLDGGHLFFYLWETILRRPASIKTREIAQQIGLVLLISLMVLAFYSDFVRFFFTQR